MYCYDYYYNYYHCVRERERERERDCCTRESSARVATSLLFPQTSREKVYTSYARKKRAARYHIYIYIYIYRTLSKSSEE